MTASPAVVTSSGVLAQPPVRDTRFKDDSASGGAGRDHHSFGDILDRANRTSDAKSANTDDASNSKDASRAPNGSRGPRTQRLRDDQEQTSDDVAKSDNGDGLTSQDDKKTADPTVQDVVLVLASLTGQTSSSDSSVQPQDDAPVDAGLLQRLLNQPAAATNEITTALPSDETDSGNAALLAAANDAAAAVVLSADETNVKVVGQETHLATVQAAPSALTNPVVAQVPVAASGDDLPVTDDVVQAKAEDGGAPVAKQAPPAVHAAALTVASASDDGSAGGFAQDQHPSDGSSQQQGTPSAATAAGASQVPSSSVIATTFTQGVDQASTSSSTPAAQIASRVTSEMATTPVSDGSVKVLHIELKPQNLGTVTVRISLKNDVISLHLETSRHDTALAIEKERASLTSALKSAGYVVDEITTQPADAFRSNTRVEAAANADGSGSSSLSQGQSDGRSAYRQDFGDSGRRGGGGQRDDGQDVSLTPTSGVSESGEASSRARADAIYV